MVYLLCEFYILSPDSSGEPIVTSRGRVDDGLHHALHELPVIQQLLELLPGQLLLLLAGGHLDLLLEDDDGHLGSGHG